MLFSYYRFVFRRAAPRVALRTELLGMQEKGMLHLAFDKVEIYLWKIGFVDCKWSNLYAQGHAPLGLI